MRTQSSSLIAALLLVTVAPLVGQGDRGGITGVVTDPTGAVMPHATVTPKLCTERDSAHQ